MVNARNVRDEAIELQSQAPDSRQTKPSAKAKKSVVDLINRHASLRALEEFWGRHVQVTAPITTSRDYLGEQHYLHGRT